MQDRDIVCDLMNGTKASISSYTMAIVETSNPQLRSTWQTLRSEAEQMHYQLYQMAEQKGYYTPAPQAAQQDVQKIKSTLSQSLTQGNSPSNQSNIYSSAGTSNKHGSTGASNKHSSAGISNKNSSSGMSNKNVDQSQINKGIFEAGKVTGSGKLTDGVNLP